jgi:putative PIN family toxin of toxin-antitoxin system
MMLVVLDTNVLVSGLLNGEGKPGKVVDLALENRLRVAYDDRILGEYENVLARKELGIDPSLARAIVAYLELSGQWVEAENLSKEGYPDPGDLPFAEVFVSAQAQALVIGNLRHFKPLLEQGLAVYSPAQFLERFFPEDAP